MAEKKLEEKIRELMDAGHSMENIMEILKTQGYSSEEIEEGFRNLFSGRIPKEEETKEVTPQISEKKPKISMKLLGTIVGIISLATLTFATLYFTGIFKPSPPTRTHVEAAICGNGVCEAGEDATNCPQDCGGFAPPTPAETPVETTPTTPTMPTTEGTGETITPTEENVTGYCGDGICSPEFGEDVSTCPEDCEGVTATTENVTGYCGDGICSPELGEDVSTCPEDCA